MFREDRAAEVQPNPGLPERPTEPAREGEASEAPPPAGHLTQTKTVVVSNCVSCDIEPKEECWSGKR